MRNGRGGNRFGGNCCEAQTYQDPGHMAVPRGVSRGALGNTLLECDEMGFVQLARKRAAQRGEGVKRSVERMIARVEGARPEPLECSAAGARKDPGADVREAAADALQWSRESGAITP